MHSDNLGAHGRINPYQGHPCHIELVLAPIGFEIPKAEELTSTSRNESKMAEIEE